MNENYSFIKKQKLINIKNTQQNDKTFNLNWNENRKYTNKNVFKYTVPSTNIGTLDKYEQRRLWK